MQIQVICYNMHMARKSQLPSLSQPKHAAGQTASPAAAAPQRKDKTLPVVGGVIMALVLASLLFVFSAQRRAENIPSTLDSAVLKGLVVDRTFTPVTAPRYVQISEGRDRNVSVKNLGSTLPVISRYNFKTLTADNYAVIGAAPWALSINISSNAEDPDLLRYLFNQDAMIKAFLAREDVAAVLEDPAALARLAGDETALQRFFAEEAVQQVLASEALIDMLGQSRFMAYLLLSQAGKFYRAHPAEAARLVRQSPTLSALKQNTAVRKAVAENAYLKKIAPTLLK